MLSTWNNIPRDKIEVISVDPVHQWPQWEPKKRIFHISALYTPAHHNAFHPLSQKYLQNIFKQKSNPKSASTKGFKGVIKKRNKGAPRNGLR